MGNKKLEDLCACNALSFILILSYNPAGSMLGGAGMPLEQVQDLSCAEIRIPLADVIDRTAVF